MAKLIRIATFLCFSYSAFAAPRVLISGFDPFGSASLNPSWSIAQEVVLKLKNAGIDAASCLLPTSYERSLPALEKCLAEFGEADLVISLGAGLCNVKWETRTFNRNHDRGPDNDGVSRRRQTIDPNGPRELGLRLNYSSMWCGLNAEEKKLTMVSTNPDTFVCNHLAFQYSLKNPNQMFGFIHVPSQNCLKRTPELLPSSIDLVTKMIQLQLAARSESNITWPDFQNEERLVTTKKEVQGLERDSTSPCEQEFLKRWKQGF